MQQYLCDVCGEVIKGSRNTYTGPCHLLDENLRGKPGYIDQDNNEVSGRMVTYDLCNKHSNEVHGAASMRFFDLKGTYRKPSEPKSTKSQRVKPVQVNDSKAWDLS